MIIKLNQKQKDRLWWLIISVDYDYSRITIADHNADDDFLTLWLEDRHDFKNSLDECLELVIPLKQFAKVIKAEELNSYEGQKMHPTKHYLYKTQIEINEPIAWYLNDAKPTEQQWAREAILKKMLTDLIENEAGDIMEYAA